MARASAVQAYEGADAKRTQEGKYLTFALGEEEFGIGILRVKEIIGMMPFTPIPRTPEFVKGVINLRGKVIPVLDLRLKFGMPPTEYDDRTCIVVVEVSNDEGKMAVGLVVDKVNEVSNVKEEDVEETPSFGVSLDTAYIRGMAKFQGTVKILLDIDRVITDEERGLLS
jgi:purine-binding chemotaxis protein CheW